MNILLLLIPVAVLLGLVGLLAFLWALKAGQFEDLEGEGWRLLLEEEPQETDGPAAPRR